MRLNQQEQVVFIRIVELVLGLTLPLDTLLANSTAVEAERRNEDKRFCKHVSQTLLGFVSSVKLWSSALLQTVSRLWYHPARLQGPQKVRRTFPMTAALVFPRIPPSYTTLPREKSDRTKRCLVLNRQTQIPGLRFRIHVKLLAGAFQQVCGSFV